MNDILDPLRLKIKRELEAEEDRRIFEAIDNVAHVEGVVKDGSPFRGLLFALPFGIIMWALLIGGVIAMVRGCDHKTVQPVYESVGPLPTNILIKATVFTLDPIGGTTITDTNTGKQ